jgi:sugar phosphate isomerase/epimerase
LATDSDRIFPGDGDIDITSIIKELKRIGYDGYVSMELLNPVISQSKTSQVTELGMGALSKILA